MLLVSKPFSCYNWSEFLQSQQNYHHFHFFNLSLGVVFVWKIANCPETEVNILKYGHQLTKDNQPGTILHTGFFIDRDICMNRYNHFVSWSIMMLHVLFHMVRRPV